MAEKKTKVTDQAVQAFLERVEDDKKREDCFTLAQLMQEITGHEPRMWGSAMVGFGQYHYKNPGGSEGEMFLAGFSPRKQNLTLYIMSGFDEYEALLSKIGKYKTGKSCLYLKTLKEVDLNALREMIARSVEHMRKTNPS